MCVFVCVREREKKRRQKKRENGELARAEEPRLSSASTIPRKKPPSHLSDVMCDGEQLHMDRTVHR